jgi:hypothetical protein
MKPRQTGPVSKNLPYNLSIQASGSGSELTVVSFTGSSRCVYRHRPVGEKSVVDIQICQAPRSEVRFDE